MSLAVETVSFWGKKLAQSSGKSQFAEAYDTLKKLDITLPKTYEYYKV